MTRKNNGFREPEFRLYSLIPGAFIMGGGLIMYGVGAAHGLSWVLPAFGMGFVAFALTIGGAVMMGFVIDCYKEIAPQAVTCVIIIRNTMGFAVTFGTIGKSAIQTRVFDCFHGTMADQSSHCRMGYQSRTTKYFHYHGCSRLGDFHKWRYFYNVWEEASEGDGHVVFEFRSSCWP